MVLRKNCDLLFTDLIYSRRFSGITLGNSKEKSGFFPYFLFFDMLVYRKLSKLVGTLPIALTSQACLLAHLEIQKSYFPAQQ